MTDRTRRHHAPLLTALTLAMLSSATAVPAHAAGTGRAPLTASVKDPSGDVVTDLAAATPTTTGNVDVRAVAVRLLPGRRIVRARIRFTDLTPATAPAEPMQHQVLLLVHHGAAPDRAVTLERSPWPPHTRTYVEHPDGHRSRCAATVRVNLKRDVVRLDIPVTCLRPGVRRARFSVVSAGLLTGSATDVGTWVGTDVTRATRAIRLR